MPIYLVGLEELYRYDYSLFAILFTFWILTINFTVCNDIILGSEEFGWDYGPYDNEIHDMSIYVVLTVGY